MQHEPSRAKFLAITLSLGSVLASALTAPAAHAADEKQACVTASDDAQKLRDERKLTKAREQMVLCAREACPGIVRKDCLQWLSEVEASLPSVVLSARNAQGGDISSAKVTVDGVMASDKLDGKSIFVDPGPHTFKFEVEGQPAVEQQAVIREGEKNRAITATFGTTAAATPDGTPNVVMPPAEPDKKSAPVAGYILGGVGAVAIGSFVFFGLTGKSDVSALRDGCGKTQSCAQDDVDSAKSKLIIADVSLGIGIVALGIATYLILTHDSSPSAKATAAASVQRNRMPSFDFGARSVPGGGAATLGGRF